MVVPRPNAFKLFDLASQFMRLKAALLVINTVGSDMDCTLEACTRSNRYIAEFPFAAP
jgi:hypothetical protein